MSHVVLKRGTKAAVEQQPLQDGLLSFSIDDGRIYLDYKDANDELKRKIFYSGKLTFGPYSYDGTEDVDVKVYKGEIL